MAQRPLELFDRPECPRMHRETSRRTSVVACSDSDRLKICVAFFMAAAIWLSVLSMPASASDHLQKASSWQTLDDQSVAKEVRGALDRWGLDPLAIDRVVEALNLALETSDRDALDAAIESLREPIEVVDDLFVMAGADLSTAAQSMDPDTPTYAAVESLPKTIRMSLRTWLGRELVRRRLYDEALPVIAEVDPLETVDPAAALFFRGACYHALLMKDDALKDLRRLLENESSLPQRYSHPAKLMIADISPLKDDSLDEVSRLMTDVSRRLDLGRTGDEVQRREQEIIDKLSKLIDDIEKQQQQQQQQQASGGGGGQGGGQGQPMQESQAGGASGKGDVDRKSIAQTDAWGNLPPAQRKQTLQQISRDLPTHYRDAIEAYFRKLATESK